jgi:hypothetical protein
MTPRLTVENVPHRLDVHELLKVKAFPDQRQPSRRNTIGGWRFLCVKHLVVSLSHIEVHHHGNRIQRIPVRWYCSPLGDAWHQSPLLVCSRCGHARRTLYFQTGHFACRVCMGLSYASKQCSAEQRPLLQRLRIEHRLQHSPYMQKKTRRYWEARLHALPKSRARVTKRLSSLRVQLPLGRWTFR